MAARTLYWIGGSGDLTDAAHWSLASDGSGGGEPYPTYEDVVIFNHHSFGAPGATVTNANEIMYCKSMTWADATNAPTLNAVYPIYINGGALILISGMTIPENTLIVIGSSLQLTSAGHTFKKVSTTGTLTINDDITVDGNDTTTNIFHAGNDDSGGLVTNGHSITAPYVFLGSMASSRTRYGSTTITCRSFNGSCYKGTTDVLSVVLTGVGDLTLAPAGFSHAGHTIENLTILPIGSANVNITTDVDVTTNLTMYSGNYIITAGKKIDLKNCTLVCNSTSLSRVCMRSSISGTPFLMGTAITLASRTLEYIELKDCTAVSAVMYANYSVDLGGNTGWVFPDYETMFFMFADKLYAWNGLKYQSYDGVSAMTEVVGYRPTVAINAPPTGGGTTYELVNMLTDGVTTTFTPSQATETDTAQSGDATHIQLAATASAVDDHYNTATIRITWGTGSGQERTILDYAGGTTTAEVSVAWVTNPDNTSVYTITGIPVATNYVVSSSAISSIDKVTVDGVEIVEGAGAGKYTKTLTAPATVTFGTAPTGGVGSVEIDWTMSYTGNRNEMDKYRYAIDYSGDNDYRMFIWGNPAQKNRRRWSGLANGIPSAEYFETTAFDDIGNGEYAITDIVRHYSYQKIFLENGVKYSHYDTMEIGGITTAIFPVFELNEDVGNVAYGQVKVVDNKALSLFRGIHSWSRTNVREETNEKMISDRINKDLLLNDLSTAKTVVWYKNKEYWLHIGSKVYVYNYINDTFYTFDNINATCFIVIDDEMYFGTATGTVEKFDTSLTSDNGTAISAKWRMGYTDCGVNYRYKNSYGIYVSARVDGSTYYEVGYSTENGSSVSNVACPVDYADILDFADIDFANFTFATYQIMSPLYLDIPTRDFTYISYTIESATADDVCTILSLTIPLRYSGKV
jgi:hypothetical protein